MTLRIETSKLQVKTWKNFKILFKTFILEFGLFFKLVDITWFTSQSLWKESFKEDPKIFLKFQNGVLKFQF